MSDNHIADHQRRDYERQAVPVDDEIDLLAIFRTLWRGKWVIGLVTSIAIVLGVYYAFGIAIPKYTATAVVALESRQEIVVDLESVMSGLGGDQISINTEIEVLRSRGLIAKLVARMALQDDPEFNPSLRPEQRFSIGKLIGVFAGHAQAPIVSTQTVLDSTVNTVLEAVSISNLRQSYAFTISVVTTNPEKSAAIANTLAELYILDQIEVKFAATEQATIWLSERVAVLQEDLETAEAAVQVLSGSTELVSAEALEAVNRQIKETRDRLADVDSRVISTQARVNALIDASASSDRVLMAAIASDSALDRLLETKGDNTAFMAQFNAILLRARNDLDRARAQSSSLAFAVSTLETDFAVQSADLAELQQLQREAALTQLNAEVALRRATSQEGRTNFETRLALDAVVRDYVYLAGEVGVQGRYTLPFERRASLADALYDEAGGVPTNTGNIAEVYVLRDMQTGAGIVAWRLDARNAANLVLATQFELRPNDIVFVAEQPVTAWNRVIQQITPSLITSTVGAATN